jgi:hypothetical protein
MTLQDTPQRRCHPTNPFFFTAKQPEDLGSHLTPSGATVTRPWTTPWPTMTRPTTLMTNPIDMEHPDRPETTNLRSQSLKTSMRPMLTPKGLGSRETPTTPKEPRSLESDRPGATRPAGDGRPEDRRLQGQSRITLTRTKSIQRDCARGRPRPTPNPRGRTRRTRCPEWTATIGCHGRRTYTYTLECRAYFVTIPTHSIFGSSLRLSFFFQKAKGIKGTSNNLSTGELPSWRSKAKSRKPLGRELPCLATDFSFFTPANEQFLSTKIMCRCRK